ncbi:MAG: acetyltransferase [Cyanobacteria bacterium J06649_4]
MSSIPLVVLGALGNCLDIVDAALAGNKQGSEPAFEVLGYLDDEPSRQGIQVRGFPVLGPLAMARDMPQAQFVNGIGSSRSHRHKKSMIESLGLGLERFATIVHPSAVIASSATIGHGCVIMANATVCANVTLGNQVMMLPNCVVGHDSAIEDYSILAAGVTVSGVVKVGHSCYLGANSCIKEYVHMGEQALLGMGAVAIKTIPANAVMVGNPARLLRQYDK